MDFFRKLDLTAKTAWIGLTVGVLLFAAIWVGCTKDEEPAEETPAATSESITMETSTSITTTTSDLTSGEMGTDTMTSDLVGADVGGGGGGGDGTGEGGGGGGQRHEKSPCDPPFLSLPDMITCAKLMDLKEGNLAFEPRKVMDQGQEERVFVRVSREAKVTSALQEGFKEGPPVTKAIQVGPVMRAVLDYSQMDFSVRRVGEEKKLVEAPYTEWSWEVTPLVGGNKELRVLVYAELMLPNGNREPYEAFTGSAVIQVHTRPSYLVGKFVSENWQWMLGSPLVLGLCGWLGVRLRRSKKKRQAGF